MVSKNPVIPRTKLPLALVAIPLLNLCAAPGDLRWSRPAPNRIWLGTAVTPDGSVIAVNSPAATGNGTLLRVAPDGTNTLQAVVAFGTAQSPVIRQDGTVLVLDRSGIVRAFDNQLQPLWTQRVGRATTALALLPEDRLAIVADSADGGARSLTVLAKDGKVTANATLTMSGISRSGPLVRFADGFLACTGDSTSELFLPPTGLNTPVQEWPFETLEVIGLAPMASLGMAVTQSNSVAGLRAGTGIVWYRANLQPSTAPVVTPDNRVVFGTANGQVMALNSDGTTAWTLATTSTAPVASVPAIAEDGTVWVGAEDGILRGIGPDGTVRWSLPLGSAIRGPISLLPNGDVVCGTAAGTLACVEGSAPLARSGWPKWQGDAANTGNDSSAGTIPPAATGLSATDSGEIRVSWDPVPGARRVEIWRSTNASVSDAVLLPGPRDRNIIPGTEYRYWIRGTNGLGVGPFGEPAVIVPQRLAWTVIPAGEPVPASDSVPPDERRLITGMAELSDGRLAVSGITAGQRLPALTLLNRDGTTAWQWKGTNPVTSATAPMIDPDGRLVCGFGLRLMTFDPDGTQVSSLVSPYPWEGALAMGSGGRVLGLGVNDPQTYRLYSVHRANGSITLLRSQPHLWPSDSLRVAGDGTILWSSDTEVEALTASGQVRWSRPFAGGSVLSGNRVLVVSSARVEVLATDGTVLRSYPAPSFSPARQIDHPRIRASLPVVEDGSGTVWYAAGADVVRLAPDRAPELLVPATVLHGAITSLAVDRNARLLVSRLESNREFTRVDLLATDGTPLEAWTGFGGSFYPQWMPILASTGRLYLASDVGVVAAFHAPFDADPAAPWSQPRRSGAGDSRAPQAGSVATLPVNLVVPARGTNGVRLTWTSTGQAVGYEVLRSEDGNLANATVIGTTDLKTSHFDDAGVNAGTTPTYWVRTVSGNTIAVSAPQRALPRPQQLGHFAMGVTDGSGEIAVGLDGTIVVGASSRGRARGFLPDGTVAWDSAFPAPVYSAIPIGLPSGEWEFSTFSGAGIAFVPTNSTAVNVRHPSIRLTGLPGGRGIYATSAGIVGIRAVGTTNPLAPLMGTNSFRPFEFASADGAIYVPLRSGELVCMDADGTVRWRSHQPGATGWAPGPDGSVLVSLSNPSFACIEADGTTRWSLPGDWRYPVYDRDGGIVAKRLEADGQTRLFSLDPVDGRVRWNLELPTDSRCPIACADGTVIVSWGSLIWAVSATTGAPVWAAETGTLGTAPANQIRVSNARLNADGLLAVPMAAGRCVVFQLATGPAASGWPMFRHDSLNTGLQGGDSPRALVLRRGLAPDGHTPVIRMAAADGGVFLPMAGEDLHALRLIRNPIWESETIPGENGPLTRPILRIDLDPTRPALFLRATAP